MSKRAIDHSMPFDGRSEDFAHRLGDVAIQIDHRFGFLGAHVPFGCHSADFMPARQSHLSRLANLGQLPELVIPIERVWTLPGRSRGQGYLVRKEQQ